MLLSSLRALHARTGVVLMAQSSPRSVTEIADTFEAIRADELRLQAARDRLAAARTTVDEELARTRRLIEQVQALTVEYQQLGDRLNALQEPPEAPGPAWQTFTTARDAIISERLALDVRMNALHAALNTLLPLAP